MLAAAGIISDADRDALLGGLERVRGGARRRLVPRSTRDDEDIHMAIERRLTEIVGPVGGKLHTARSRNDQVATDMAMFTRAHALQTLETAAAPAERARRSSPSATRTGRCRATRTSSARSRSTSRTTCWPTSGCSGATRGGSSSCSARRASCRSARARWPGVNFATDRAARRRASSASPASCRTRSTPSPTATSCSTSSPPPRPARPTSRGSGAEIVLWSSEEFGFCEVSDAWASGSSIMPQKKNPDAAELLRGKAPRVVAGLMRAARRDARPPADLQQGHAGGQGAAVRRRRHARPVPAGGGGDARGDRVRPRAAGRRRRPTS